MLEKNSINASLEHNRFDDDEFWSGLGEDDQGTHELFFSATESGPTDSQIETYFNFLNHLNEFKSIVRKKILDKIMTETPREIDIANLAEVQLNIVKIPIDSNEYDIEAIFRLS